MFNVNLIEKLKLIFNFSKKTKDKRKAGVIDEGKESLYINCEGTGPDAGLINKGKRNKFVNSKWNASKK